MIFRDFTRSKNIFFDQWLQRKNTVRLQKTERKNDHCLNVNTRLELKEGKKKRREQASSHTLDNIYKSKRMCKNTQRRLTLKKNIKTLPSLRIKKSSKTKGKEKEQDKIQRKTTKIRGRHIKNFYC